MKLQSKFGIVAASILFIFFACATTIVAVWYSGSTSDKFALMVLFGFMAMVFAIVFIIEATHFLVIDDKSIQIHSLFRNRTIALHDIRLLKIHQPRFVDGRHLSYYQYRIEIDEILFLFQSRQKMRLVDEFSRFVKRVKIREIKISQTELRRGQLIEMIAGGVIVAISLFSITYAILFDDEMLVSGIAMFVIGIVVVLLYFRKRKKGSRSE